MFEQLMNLDGQILLFIQDNIRTPWLTPIMRFFSFLANGGIGPILLCLAFLAFRKTRKAGVYSAVAIVLMAIVVNLILKPLVGRVRPYDAVEGLTALMARLKDFSFPSGHSAASFAVAVGASYGIRKKYSVVLIVIAALISLSRLYVGVHYPTDVLVGVLIGILAGVLGAKIGKVLCTRWDFLKRNVDEE